MIVLNSNHSCMHLAWNVKFVILKGKRLLFCYHIHAECSIETLHFIAMSDAHLLFTHSLLLFCCLLAWKLYRALIVTHNHALRSSSLLLLLLSRRLTIIKVTSLLVLQGVAEVATLNETGELRRIFRTFKVRQACPETISNHVSWFGEQPVFIFVYFFRSAGILYRVRVVGVSATSCVQPAAEAARAPTGTTSPKTSAHFAAQRVTRTDLCAVTLATSTAVTSIRPHLRQTWLKSCHKDKPNCDDFLW